MFAIVTMILMETARPDKGMEARPFLRWVGGKRWLVPYLSELVGDMKFGAYHEPFLGGGAAFLGLNPQGKSFLADLNPELVETYIGVRDDPEAVAQVLKRHKNVRDYYYDLRESRPRLPATKAARFIFLNHTSYNGVFRVNRDGKYNVPFGHRRWVNIPTQGDLLAVSRRLLDATIRVADFGSCIDDVAEGDLVFLDPPYTVAHNNNGFVHYNRRLFSWEDQARLSRLIDQIRSRGAFYILTNAAHSSIVKLFDKGDWCVETNRKNAIGGAQASRGTATELLFTNLDRP